VLFPKGRDPERADEFRVCGDEHLVEPFEVYTLLMLAESELARSSEEEVIFDQQVCIQFPTNEENLTTAGQFLADVLSYSGLDDEKQVALNAAFREAILNAAQHGNRYNPRTQVKVLYLLGKQKVTVVVTDEGQGFNHSVYMKRSESGDAVSAARERYEQGRLGGLGIMLMLRCTDQLEYNEKGNQITLTKLR
jgi:serine/threonine-protein kinase RsbW